jgi:hypothetical protein
MKRTNLVFWLSILSLALAGCGSALPSIAAPTATASPTPGVAVNPALVNQLSNNCNLVNSQDLASIFGTGELEREPVKDATVDHPAFSTENVPANEVTCVMYEFHNPGKTTEELLQVTYWVDTPGQGAPGANALAHTARTGALAHTARTSAWQRAWADAAQSGQAVSGIGDQAFFSQTGQLVFRQGGLYFTLELVDTSQTASWIEQVSRQVAKDMLQHLASLTAAG